MVFLTQNTQNRDGAAVQIKLDEIIRSLEGAHNALLDLEELSEPELEAFHDKYVDMARPPATRSARARRTPARRPSTSSDRSR
jgi:low affinity Fe/Cu permease